MNFKLAGSKPVISKDIILFFVFFIALAGVFMFLPNASGGDWKTLRESVLRIVEGKPPYGGFVEHRYEHEIVRDYYFLPPWFSIVMLPIVVLPFTLGRAIIAALSLVLSLVLLEHWNDKRDMLKALLVLLSPAMLFIEWNGQIDVVVAMGVLLPVESRILVAAIKPQTVGGLVFGIPREKWLKALLIFCGVFVVTLLLWGLWPIDVLRQPSSTVREFNLWINLWPFQVPLGVIFVLMGIARKDERFLIIASPFLSPYSTFANFQVPWIACCTLLDRKQSLLVFASWWGALIYRIIVA